MGSNEVKFKYSIFTVQIFSILLVYASFNFGYHILQSFFILGCMWYLDYPEYLKVYSLNLWMLVKDFFITINVFKNFVHLLWFKLNFNECTIRKYTFSSWRPSPFIMIFIINHKTPTMTAQQFYKQTLFYWLLLTDDRKIAESWNLVLTSSMKKYFKNTQNCSAMPLLFYLELQQVHFKFEFYVIYTFQISPMHFSLFSLSLVTSFLVVAVQPCIEWN